MLRGPRIFQLLNLCSIFVYSRYLCLWSFCFGENIPTAKCLNDISRNCLMEHGKKIAKFLMRPFTCRSTFLYGPIQPSRCLFKRYKLSIIGHSSIGLRTIGLWDIYHWNQKKIIDAQLCYSYIQIPDSTDGSYIKIILYCTVSFIVVP